VEWEAKPTLSLARPGPAPPLILVLASRRGPFIVQSLAWPGLAWLPDTRPDPLSPAKSRIAEFAQTKRRGVDWRGVRGVVGQGGAGCGGYVGAWRGRWGLGGLSTGAWPGEQTLS
jgi:hypothetical protein